MTKVYYIQHSTFLIEYDDRYLLFDYFNKDVLADRVEFHGGMPILDDNKHLYVFASHGHKDHFDLEVLRWAKERNDITYILSKHIRLGANYLKRNDIESSVKDKIKFVTPLNTYQVDDMEIQTLRSNDEGVAFIVKVCGQIIYHAGDLHWWNWSDRGELYCEAIGLEYKRQLRALSNMHIDFGFVVLDPRMNDGYYLGLDYFVKNIDCDLIFPMHLWGEYKLIDDFKRRPDLGRLADKIIKMDRENMVFEIED